MAELLPYRDSVAVSMNPDGNIFMQIRTLNSTSDTNTKVAPQSAQSSEDLFAQFSQTLDQIANKVAGNNRINAALKNVVDSPVGNALPQSKRSQKSAKVADPLASLTIKTATNSNTAAKSISLVQVKDPAPVAAKPAVVKDLVSAKDNSSDSVDPDARGKARSDHQATNDDSAKQDPNAASMAAAQILPTQKQTVTDSQPQVPVDNSNDQAVAASADEVANSPTDAPAATDPASAAPATLPVAMDAKSSAKNADSATDSSNKISDNAASSAVHQDLKNVEPGTIDAHLAELHAQIAAAPVAQTQDVKPSTTSASDQQNSANYLEKLILEQALVAGKADQNGSSKMPTPVELNLQNLNSGSGGDVLQKLAVTSQLNALSAANAASGNQAQALQSVIGQSPKSAENSGKGSTKETMKTLTHTQESRTMEKVESALREVSRAKDGKSISLRLDPPDLGTVKVDVSLRDGNLHARVVAETPQVTALLKEKSHELVQMMRKLGLNVDKVTVAVGQQQESSSSNLNSSDSSSQGNTKQKQSDGRSSNGESELLQAFASAADGQSPSSTVVDDHWVA